jgi:hypothetical protein
MNIFSRLYKVFSSNLPHFEKNRNWKGPAGRQKDFGDSREGNSQSGHLHPQNGKSYDPVLAEYYANLELPYGADLERVRNAWKRMVRKYHPDLHCADPEKRQLANELSQGLNRAYEELKKRLGDTKNLSNGEE